MILKASSFYLTACGVNVYRSDQLFTSNMLFIFVPVYVVQNTCAGVHYKH